jgi:hypothetical protein
MSKTTKIMRRAMTCGRKQEQLLRGQFYKSLRHLSNDLLDSASREWDRMIRRKYKDHPAA